MHTLKYINQSQAVRTISKRQKSKLNELFTAKCNKKNYSTTYVYTITVNKRLKCELSFNTNVNFITYHIKQSN